MEGSLTMLLRRPRLSVLSQWWYSPVPRVRVAVLRSAVYLFVPFDMLVLTNSALAHAYLPHNLYQPVFFARVLHLPAPTPVVMHAIQVVVIGACLVAASGRLPRAAGWTVAIGYLYWLFASMSYGKVDHDHLPLVIAILVLPTVGRARFGDRDDCAASGWALRCVQVAVVATYFLSALAKMRWGGPGWANGETLQWALTRRRTPVGEALLGFPWLLHASQWTTLIAEFASPLLLVVRGRALLAAMCFFLGFHLSTELLMSIHFLPHVVCLVAAFTPWERLRLPRRTAAVRRESRSPGSSLRFSWPDPS
jgi:hypothetical protein